MDSGIKLHKVSGVVLEARNQAPRLVDLHLTAHHTILVHGASKEETWVSHSLLLSIHLQPPSPEHHLRTPLVLRGRDFEIYTILFSQRSDAKAIYESLEAVIAKRTSSEQLYAFCTDAKTIDRKAWSIYDSKREFSRMGVFDSPTSKARTSAWRFTDINNSYEYCATYPASLVVPAKISDTTLNYGKSYRSKARIPGLVYLHWANLGSITRSSQPMVGLKNNRSIQDEKLIEAIFTSHSQHHSNTNPEMANASYIAHSQSQTVYGATPTNLIIDARPTTNAMANVAKGAGTENMDYYRTCKKVYLGIDNIHVMRDSLNKVAEAIRYPDQPPNYDLLRKSNWLKHLSGILEGILIIVKAIHLANSHVLVHCSDGWDRTSQLSSLSQLCLDPYYRTKEGLAVLIEKDWICFGHRFGDRCGHTVPGRIQCLNTSLESDENTEEDVGFLASFQQRLNFSSSSHVRETCPVFDQFLDVIHQLQLQFPSSFEFNDAFLLDIQRLLYECSYGTFLYNSERERVLSGASEKTKSVWQVLLDPSRESIYRNDAYDKAQQDVLFPEPKKVEWWFSWLKRSDLNNNDHGQIAQPDVPVPTVVESTAEDPVLSNLAWPSKGNSSALRTESDTERRDAASPLADSTAHRQSNGRAFPAVFDSPAVSSASTAVQGAMRSAWSAWKTVRTGYENAAREQQEAEIPVRDQSSATSMRHKTPNNPAISNQENIWSSNDKRSVQNGTSASPSNFPISAITPPPAEPVEAAIIPAITAPTQEQSPMKQESTSVASRPEETDPLGVNVWR